MMIDRKMFMLAVDADRMIRREVESALARERIWHQPAETMLPSKWLVPGAPDPIQHREWSAEPLHVDEDVPLVFDAEVPEADLVEFLDRPLPPKTMP